MKKYVSLYKNNSQVIYYELENDSFFRTNENNYKTIPYLFFVILYFICMNEVEKLFEMTTNITLLALALNITSIFIMLVANLFHLKKLQPYFVRKADVVEYVNSSAAQSYYKKQKLNLLLGILAFVAGIYVFMSEKTFLALMVEICGLLFVYGVVFNNGILWRKKAIRQLNLEDS